MWEGRYLGNTFLCWIFSTSPRKRIWESDKLGLRVWNFGVLQRDPGRIFGVKSKITGQDLIRRSASWKHGPFTTRDCGCVILVCLEIMWPVVVGDPFVPRITLSKKVQVYDGPLETTARCKSIYVEKWYSKSFPQVLPTKDSEQITNKQIFQSPSPPSDLYNRWGGKTKNTQTFSQMKLVAVSPPRSLSIDFDFQGSGGWNMTFFFRKKKSLRWSYFS